MKAFYCANCGLQLKVTRKALPKFGTIIDIVEWHKCSDKPLNLDLVPIEVPKFVKAVGKDKFVQKLNDLNPLPKVNPFLDSELKDRRFEHGPKPGLKSTAPKTVLSMLEKMENSIPENTIENLESEETQ